MLELPDYWLIIIIIIIIIIKYIYIAQDRTMLQMRRIDSYAL